jgi:hypothetical protein
MSTANRTLTPVYRHLCAFHHFRIVSFVIRIVSVAVDVHKTSAVF